MKHAKKAPITWRKITDSRLFFPLVILSLILLFDLIFIPGFFTIENRDGNLYGSLIDILRNGSTVSLLAIGMTLVIATGGVDLSVGAVMAISASVAGILMNPSALWNEVFFVTDPTYTFQPLWVVILAALFVAILCGLWNGVLVAYMKIQPMVATLVLMIAGRGIAQLITNGLRVQITYRPFSYIGQGWFIMPFSLYLVIFILIVSWLLTRKTAIGMFIESVGINFRSSFFSGIKAQNIKLAVYTFCGFCAGNAPATRRLRHIRATVVRHVRAGCDPKRDADATVTHREATMTRRVRGWSCCICQRTATPSGTRWCLKHFPTLEGVMAFAPIGVITPH